MMSENEARCRSVSDLSDECDAFVKHYRRSGGPVYRVYCGTERLSQGSRLYLVIHDNRGYSSTRLAEIEALDHNTI